MGELKIYAPNQYVMLIVASNLCDRQPRILEVIRRSAPVLELRSRKRIVKCVRNRHESSIGVYKEPRGRDLDGPAPMVR